MLSIALKNTCDYEQSGELINHTYSALTMIINMSLLPPLICELGKFILIKLEVIVERQGTTVLVDFIHFFLVWIKCVLRWVIEAVKLVFGERKKIEIPDLLGV